MNSPIFSTLLQSNIESGECWLLFCGPVFNFFLPFLGDSFEFSKRLGY